MSAVSPPVAAPEVPESVSAPSGFLSRLPVGPCLFGLGLLTRLSNVFGVLTPVGVFPQATDSYYHLRRIGYVVRHFPHLPPDSDRYLNFPFGGPVEWPYGFDFCYGTFIQIVTLGQANQWWIYALASVLTPLIGALTACLTCQIGIHLGNQKVGLWAGLLTAILPALTITGGIGYVDHHVFESFWLAFFLLAYLRAIAATSPQILRIQSILAGCGITAGLLTTTMIPLLLPLHAGVFFWQTVRAWKEPDLRQRLWGVNALVWLTTSLSLMPFVATRWAEPAGVSPALTISWVLAFSMAVVSCLGSHVSGFPVASGLYRAGWLLLGVLGGLACWRLDFTSATKLITFGFRHLSTTDPWIASIQESQHLFSKSFRYIAWTYSGFFIFFPIALGWLLVRGWRSSLAGWTLGILTLPLAVLACLQLRFSDIFTVPYALVTGFFIQVMVQKLNQWFDRHPQLATFKFKPLLWAGLGLAFLWPTVVEFSFSRPFVVVEGSTFVNLYPSLLWIAEHTPPTSPQGDQPQDYAIAADWNLGHWLLEFSHRPVVASPLGHGVHRQGLRDGAAILTFPPEDSFRLMQTRRVRYVLVTPMNAQQTLRNACWDETTNQTVLTGEDNTLLRKSLLAELLGHDGVPFERPAAQVLRHFRLVHETAPDRHYPGLNRPFGMLFERVPGAQLRGQVAPLAPVTISAEIRTAGGRTFMYRDTIQADATGVFLCSLPYASGTQSFSEVGCTTGYLIEVAGKTAQVSVSEAEVLSGKPVSITLR